MYQALYRKYRPLGFEDVVGQEHIIGTIKSQIINNRISHAYMFTGTRGTGKTTCAKILARAVNCTNPVNGNPCNECESCRSILNGSSIDVIEIDAASNNGIDNIRELREDVIFTPATAKYKVYIIDEVHMLTNQAFNGLLKTLEEPPAHIIFVFATTEINKVPQTILSRCQRFDFKRITVDDIVSRLNIVSSKEGITLDTGAALSIAKLADGAMRDALSILDRCAGNEKSITLATVERTVGICSFDEISHVITAIADDDAETALEFYSECRHNSKDPASLFSELCSYFRDITVIKLSKAPEKYLVYEPQTMERIKDIAAKFTLEKTVRSIRILQQGIYDIMKFSDKHIMAEMTLIKLTSPKIGDDYSDFDARLSKLELFGVSDVPKTSKPAPKTKAKKAERSNAEITASGTQCVFWDKLLEALPLIGGKSVVPIIRDMKAQTDGELLYIIGPPDSFAKTFIGMDSNKALIEDAAQRVSGTQYTVIYRSDEEKAENTDDALNEILAKSDEILVKE